MAKLVEAGLSKFWANTRFNCPSQYLDDLNVLRCGAKPTTNSWENQCTDHMMDDLENLECPLMYWIIHLVDYGFIACQKK